MPSPGATIPHYRWELLPRDKKISRTLSRVLRHEADYLGIDIRPDGFCGLGEVLQLGPFQDLEATEEDVVRVAQTNIKKRFELAIDDRGAPIIRAAQGHSIKKVEDDLLLYRLIEGSDNLPAVCAHGTRRRSYRSILKRGLLAGGELGTRNHIHFIPSDPWDRSIVSGLRCGSEIAIFIDPRSALRDGIPFFISANRVILSPGFDGCIAAKYFVKVVDLRSRETIKLEGTLEEDNSADASAGASRGSGEE